VRSGVDPVRNLLFLLAYNAAFVVPLVVVIVLVQRGMKLSRLVQWSVREVFVGKLLMGVLFTVMAVVVAAMAMKAGAG
jgi:cytochrome c biogenesis protein CcdA